MVFKVIFDDGSIESVQANTITDARIYSRRLFHNRVVASVKRAGLTDIAVRPPTNIIKTLLHKE